MMTGDSQHRISRVQKSARLCAILLGTLVLGACGYEMSDLQDFVAQEKAKPPGPIEPLPQVKPAPSFNYDAQALRSPFTPDFAVGAVPGQGEGGGGPCPDPNRNSEYLESFPLDGLRMVGTLTLAGEEYALISDPDRAVHRVQVGNYVGQNFGRVTSIGEYSLDVLEVVPDGLGGCMERPAGMEIAE